MGKSSRITVDCDWLMNHLKDEKLVVLDASIVPVTGAIDHPTENLYVPGALRFDLDNEMSDKQSPYSHTLLSDDDFITHLQQLGINENSIVVIYDDQGIYSSPRAWYMFRNIGFETVYVLEGGLPEWKKKGFPTASDLSKPKQIGDIRKKESQKYFCDASEVDSAIGNDSIAIVDARSAGRFYGTEAEPRKNMKSGHIPGSFNIPFKNVLKDGKFNDLPSIRETLDSIIAGKDKAIFSCGSGITSCIVAMAAELNGYSNVCIYDGSWSEWGDERNDYPVV